MVRKETVIHRISETVETVENTVRKNIKEISDNQPNVKIPQLKVKSPLIFSQEEVENTPPLPNRISTQDENSSGSSDVREVSQDARAALNKDPGYPWGIVVTNSFYYDSAMQRIGILAGGTVVARKQSLIKKDGYVAECFYLINRSWQDETIYLYEADLVMFDVTYQVADKEQRDLLVEYCRTKGMLEELRSKAYKEALRRNPYFEQYKNVVEESKAFTQKTRDAKEEFDTASGDRRSVLADQLRQYQAEEVVIMQRYNALKEPYDTWKTQNIGDEKTPRITKTIEIQNLENRLNGMSEAVQELVPGL